MLQRLRYHEGMRNGLFLTTTLLVFAACSSITRKPSSNDSLVTTEAQKLEGRLSPAMKQFVLWEADSNFNPNGSQRDAGRLSLTPYQPEYLEWELNHEKLYQMDNYTDYMSDSLGKGPNAVILDESASLHPNIRKHLFIKRDGKTFCRFYLSPDDKPGIGYGEEIESYLKHLGVPYKRATSDELLGYRTASRSLIFFDKDTGFSFSFKPSTKQTATDYRNRVTPMRWGHLNRRLNDYFMSMSEHLQHLKIAQEELVFGFPFTPYDNKQFGDIAYQIREMDDVSLGKKVHASGFVFYNKAEAERIALSAGKSYQEFWKEAFYIKGRAMAEMAAVLGFHYTSTHAQNFRWEFNPDGSLSGKMVMLDLSDGSPIQEIFEARGQRQLLRDWKKYVSDTNPIQSRGLGFSGFVRPDYEFQTEMARGVEDRLRELIAIDDASLEGIMTYYRGMLNSERGHFQRIGNLQELVKDQVESRGIRPANATTSCANEMSGLLGR